MSILSGMMLDVQAYHDDRLYRFSELVPSHAYEDTAIRSMIEQRGKARLRRYVRRESERPFDENTLELSWSEHSFMLPDFEESENG